MVSQPVALGHPCFCTARCALRPGEQQEEQEEQDCLLAQCCVGRAWDEMQLTGQTHIPATSGHIVYLWAVPLIHVLVILLARMTQSQDLGCLTWSCHQGCAGITTT
jgi:hypothetical protein